MRNAGIPRHRIGVIAASLFYLATPPTGLQVAAADPINSFYAFFDGFPSDPSGNPQMHYKLVDFDGVSELFPCESCAVGNDLHIDEVLLMNADGSQTISIWIEADEGQSLFVNELDPNMPVVFRLQDMTWAMEAPVIARDFELFLTFGVFGVPIEPMNPEPYHEFYEQPDSMLQMEFDLDPNDFTHPLFGDATDLNLTFTVEFPPFGDITADGEVDIGDFTLWAGAFGSTGAGLREDLNADEIVDIADFTCWADAIFGGVCSGGESGVSQVPEPSTLALFAIGVFVIATCGWRSRSGRTKS